MSRKGIVILAGFFGIAFLLLDLVFRGYREFEAMQSMEKATAAVRRKFPDARPISGAELASLQDGPAPLFLFDVRSEEEYAVSRLRHAVHDADSHNVLSFAGKPGRTVLYDSHGARSAEFAEALTRQWGHEVSYLEGGIFQWANEGRPLVDAAGNPTDKVHPHNRYWGRLLAPERRAE